MNAKGKSGSRYNLSFATKFCCYASQFLKLTDNYSKYDSVVAGKLPFYIEAYLGSKVAKGHFIVKSNSSLEERLKTYLEYADCINSIIAKLKDVNMTRIELDHIIWYSFK